MKFYPPYRKNFSLKDFRFGKREMARRQWGMEIGEFDEKSFFKGKEPKKVEIWKFACMTENMLEVELKKRGKTREEVELKEFFDENRNKRYEIISWTKGEKGVEEVGMESVEEEKIELKTELQELLRKFPKLKGSRKSTFENNLKKAGLGWEEVIWKEEKDRNRHMIFTLIGLKEN